MKRFCALLLVSVLLGGLVPTAHSLDNDSTFEVIVHPSNTISSLSRTDLERIFRRSKRSWNDGTSITPLNLPFGLSARENFTKTILRSSNDELVEYWNRRYFHGEFPPSALHSVEAMLEYVAETPGAIGYVPRDRATERIGVVRVKVED
jgi:ABC-type phosphate transport system substrate-binding protein